MGYNIGSYCIILAGGLTVLKMRIAAKKDYGAARDFYYSLIDGFERMEYSPGWKKGVYPTDEYLFECIENGELYIGETKGNTAACMVINHKYNDGYKKVRWSVQAEDSELFVIHILGVSPLYSGKGIAKLMVQKAIEIAREQKIKTIRLDVLAGNIPAEKVYTKMGFRYLETVQMYYDDTGWTSYKLFELIL